MRVTELDLREYDRAVDSILKIREHRRSTGPITKAEDLYYTLMHKLMRGIRESEEQGLPFVLYEMSVPNEIFVGLGILGIEYDMACGTLTTLLRAHEAVYGAALKVGVREEICSAQRTPVGILAKGWFPRPAAVVYSNLDQCDNCAQTGNILGELYGLPTFFLNRPYRWGTERGVQLMTEELEDLVGFLEEKTGRKMDWDRLKEAVRLSAEQVRLIREIHKLATAKPCPLKGRAASFAHWIRWAYAGTQEGLEYFQAFRDELKDMVDRGVGVANPERFRLISLFTPPQNQMKLLDWLEHEHGAVFVAEPYYLRFGDYDMDPSRPLESLARQYFNESYYRYYGPAEEYLDMIVRDARESGAEAAINWFNSKCRMGGALSKMVKDTLAEEVGIPVLTVDVDLLDPSPAAEKRTKERIEGFLESLAMGKRAAV
jgi:benzoyl-CoA reductase/2-hydroxyglutaryl-CoA dehydratase subunit BcrC/BadD/HgdB